MSDEICPRCRSKNISIAHFRLVGYPSRAVCCRDCEHHYEIWPNGKRIIRAAGIDLEEKA